MFFQPGAYRYSNDYNIRPFKNSKRASFYRILSSTLFGEFRPDSGVKIIKSVVYAQRFLFHLCQNKFNTMETAVYF